jgi:hypothetical protein
MTTLSEQLFEDYLKENKMGFDKELGTIVHPDFWLKNPRKIVCEVREIAPAPSTQKFATGNDPYKKIRQAIKKKIRQGVEAKSLDIPYVIVLANLNFAVSTSREIVEGSMYGNINFVFNISKDPKVRAKHVGNFFVNDGKLRYARDLKDKGIAINTRVSALAIIHQINPTQQILDDEVAKAIKGISDIDRQFQILKDVSDALRKDGKVNDILIPCLKVFHNLHAKTPLGFDVFTGKYDEQYFIDPKTGKSKKYE